MNMLLYRNMNQSHTMPTQSILEKGMDNQEDHIMSFQSI